jgi:hypothetical protein
LSTSAAGKYREATDRIALSLRGLFGGTVVGGAVVVGGAEVVVVVVVAGRVVVVVATRAVVVVVVGGRVVVVVTESGPLPSAVRRAIVNSTAPSSASSPTSA